MGSGSRPGFLGLRVQPSFSVKINFILGLGLAILVAVGALSARSIDELVQTGRFESAAVADSVALEAGMAAISGAESAQRKYLITGAEVDLAEYRTSANKLRALRRGFLLGGTLEGDQQRRVRELGQLVDEWLMRSDAAVGQRASGGLAKALVEERAAASRELDARIQRVAADFRSEETRALRNRREDTAFSADISSYLVLWGTSFACVLLLWAMVVIYRNQVQREAAEQSLRDSESRLRLITDSVPAFIGFADRNNRVQFHNRAFERWLGREAEAIHGRTMPQLVGEEAWMHLAPHVEQVLAGQASQADFQLHSRDGRRIDVAARFVPQQDESGEVTGYYTLATDVSALKEVDRMKSEFITTVSHELRTPLTSIRGSLGLLAGGVTGALPDKAGQLVGIAMDNCTRLVRLVNDILDSEKMLAGKMDMKLEALDLGELVSRAVRENEGFAATHGVKVNFENAAPGVRVQADRDRLMQVAINLLSNASKHSPPGGSVDVRLEREGDKVRVSVGDRGAGVPAEFRPRLFERFAQSDSRDSRRLGGTGLGLAICRGIIERLGGEIGYLPREGGGSVFYFNLTEIE